MRTTERLVHAAIDSIVSHPLIVLLLFLIATGALGLQARNFRIDASADTLLMRGDPNYLRSRAVNRRFSPQEFLLIAYEPKTHDVLSEQTFDDLRSLTAQLKEVERVASVRSILNTPLFSLADAPLAADIDPSQWTLENQHYSIEKLREAFTGHPIYEDLLINKAQTATAMQVLFKPDEELERIDGEIVDFQEQMLVRELTEEELVQMERLQRLADPIEQRLNKTRSREVQTMRAILAPYESRANLYMGGVHVLGFQLIHIIKNDLAVFGGGIAAMICIVLFVLFRRLQWIVIPVVCCACTVLNTMGLFGLLGLKTTVISSNFIALQLILTLAIVVHLIVQYREYCLEHPDWEQSQLVAETLKRKIAPCFYAGVTTSVGFASLLFSDIRPVIAFGWMMILAMVFSIGVSLMLFPALMALFRREEAREGLAVTRWLLKGFAGLTLHRPLWIATVSVGLLAAGAAGCWRLNVENSFLNYFRESTRVRTELSFIDRQFGGSTPLDLVYTVPSAERTNDVLFAAETVQTLQNIQRVLIESEGVGKVLSVVNFTELARKLNHNRPLTEYELTVMYRLMEKPLRDDLLGSFFSPDDGQVRFSIRVKDSTPGLNRAQLLADMNAELGGLGIQEDQYSLTNLFVLYQDILQRLFRSQILTLQLVYGVLALAFWVIFRSLKVALIAMIPNVLPTVMVLGVMGWLDIPLDLMTITIAAIAMGIAVDDTIHYIHRYLEEIRTREPDEAVMQSHGSVGHAALYTSLIIILGFSLLAFSDFMPSVLFGLLTGFAMLMALLADLCVLPILLHRWVRPADA